jgi:hypothetical protein
MKKVLYEGFIEHKKAFGDEKVLHERLIEHKKAFRDEKSAPGKARRA